MNQTNTKEWEKEIEKDLFLPMRARYSSDEIPNTPAVKWSFIEKDVRDFISSLLSRRDAEVVEIVERLRPTKNVYPMVNKNDVIDEVLTALKYQKEILALLHPSEPKERTEP